MSSTGRKSSSGPDPITQSGQHRTLDAFVRKLGELDAVRRSDLCLGDCIWVRTRNSTYSIYVLGNDHYRVSGGWFDLKGLSPLRTTITGCTWDGNAVHSNLVAARGLHLEFGNDVITSAIQEVDVVRCEPRIQ